MNPTVAQKLLQETPELQEFIAYIRSEVDRLNTLQDFEKVLPENMALEVLARKRAIDVLTKILSPFLDSTEKSVGISNKEYLVD